MRSKWTSRKFWLAIAAFLGSIGTSIAGLATENKYIVTVGIICSVVSTAIYQVCESIIDMSHKNNNNTVLDTNVDNIEENNDNLEENQ